MRSQPGHCAPSKLLVERLWNLYRWPEQGLPMRAMTIEKLLRYRPQPIYVKLVDWHHTNGPVLEDYDD